MKPQKVFGKMLMVFLAMFMLTGCSSSPESTVSETEMTDNSALIATLEQLLPLEDKVIVLGDQDQWEQVVQQIEVVRTSWEKIKPQIRTAGLVIKTREFDTSLANQTGIAVRRDSEELRGTVEIGKQYIEDMIAKLEN